MSDHRFVARVCLCIPILACSVAESLGGEHISYQTVYMHQPIEGYHRIAIVGQLDGDGTLILNPNKCSVNEFGDPTVCTRIAETSVPIKIKDSNKPDPANLGRKLYALEKTGLPNPLFLMKNADPSRPARLIYNHRGEQAPVPITMEPLVYSTNREVKGSANAQPCHGKYSAQQVPGMVLIFGFGAHPTSGFSTFFGELPITIYPPEFRLMHIKPAGSAAQVITPFLVHTHFNADDKIERIFITDADGRHEVPVEQVADVK